MIGSRLNRMIPPKEAYEAWARSGSVYKAGRWLKDNKGLYNETTKLPFTSQAIWQSASYYVLENLREAREIFDEVFRANGRIAKDTDWYAFILPKIIKLPKDKYEEFMARNSYLIPYMEQFKNAKKQS